MHPDVLLPGNGNNIRGMDLIICNFIQSNRCERSHCLPKHILGFHDFLQDIPRILARIEQQ